MNPSNIWRDISGKHKNRILLPNPKMYIEAANSIMDVVPPVRNIKTSHPKNNEFYSEMTVLVPM